MVYKINSRLRHFGYGPGQVTGLNVYYMGLPSRKTPRAWSVPRPQDLTHIGELLGPATISPCTITMDLEAIICFMIDRLTRAPDKDVRVPSVGSQKYPSHDVDVIYL